MTCPRCQAASSGGLVCGACGTILPPRRLDPFAALDLPARFALSSDAIDGKVRELSRKLHPDRFAKAPAAERVASLQAATTLNDAARTLRDPLARAAALLATRGVTIGENEAVAGPLIMEIMELREALDDARAAGDAAAIAALTDGVRARRGEALIQLAVQLDDAAGAADEDAKTTLIAIKYFDRLLEAATPAASGERTV